MSNATTRDAEFDGYVVARSPRPLGVATLLVRRYEAENPLHEALISLYRRRDQVVAADNPDACVVRDAGAGSLTCCRTGLAKLQPRRRTDSRWCWDPSNRSILRWVAGEGQAD